MKTGEVRSREVPISSTSPLRSYLRNATTKPCPRPRPPAEASPKNCNRAKSLDVWTSVKKLLSFCPVLYPSVCLSVCQFLRKEVCLSVLLKATTSNLDEGHCRSIQRSGGSTLRRGKATRFGQQSYRSIRMIEITICYQ